MGVVFTDTKEVSNIILRNIAKKIKNLTAVYYKDKQEFLLDVGESNILREIKAMHMYSEMSDEDKRLVCSGLAGIFCGVDYFVFAFISSVEKILDYNFKLIIDYRNGFEDDEYLDSLFNIIISIYIRYYMERFNIMRDKFINFKGDVANTIKWLALSKSALMCFSSMETEERRILCKEYTKEKWNNVPLNEIAIDLIKTISKYDMKKMIEGSKNIFECIDIVETEDKKSKNKGII